MTVKNWFVLLTFLFVKIIVQGQDLIFKNVSDQLGLPSKECYGIIQDSRGFFWVNMDIGLIKFCNTSKMLFDSRNGLTENAVYYLGEREDNTVEMLTSSNRFLNIKNNKVIETSASKKLESTIRSVDKKLNINTFSQLYFLNKNDKGEYFFQAQSRTYLMNKRGNINPLYLHKEKQNKDLFLDLVIQDSSSFFIKHRDPIPIKEFRLENKRINLKLKNKKSQKIISVSINNSSYVDVRVKCYRMGNLTFLNIHNIVLVIKNDLSYEKLTFPSVVISLNPHPTSGLWVGTTNYGVHHFPNYKNLRKRKIELSGMSVSSTCVDREGMIWCTTLEQGLFCAISDDFEQNYDLVPKNRKITFLKSFGRSLILSSAVDQYTIYKDNVKNLVNLIKTGNIEVRDYLEFKGVRYIATVGYLGEISKNFKLKRRIKDIQTKNNVYIAKIDTSENYLYALGVGFIFRLEKDFLRSVSEKFESRGTCFRILNDNLAMVGTRDGLYLYSLNGKKSNSRFKGITSKVSNILRASDGKIYVTTLGQGLFEIDNKNAVSIKLQTPIYQMSDIVEFEPNHFFIASPNGLLEVKRNGSTFKSHLYNKADGLISDFVERLTVFDGFIYLSGYEGILKLNPKKLHPNFRKPKFYFRNISVNNKRSKLQNIKLSHKENNINFLIDIIQFKSGKNEGLFYKLVGRDKSFQQCESNNINFENLPPGRYKLIVYVRNSDGIASERKSIEFEIALPIWKEWWFVFLLVFSIIGLTVLIVNSIVKSIKKREQEKTELYRLVEESKLTALQAQMNPHFIFNAINSIQNFILNKKELDAYSYLAKFSKLIRIVLNNVGNHNHTLEEELNLLNLYIELEKMRFEKSFIFKVSIDEEIEIEDVLVPVLLIQPYVENAIWHGLMPLDSNKSAQLSLKITSYKDYLKIEIIDNGIGRKKSLKMKEGKLHHSKGMSLTKQRIEVMGKMTHQNKVSVTVVDLEDENGNPAGTNVQLIIPYSLEK